MTNQGQNRKNKIADNFLIFMQQATTDLQSGKYF